jgi:putative DNA primase/helicase
MRELADIKQDLRASAEALALDLFGQPTSKTSQQWRWGRKGSLSFNVRGRYAGNFKNWETDEVGSPLDAIMLARGADFEGAVEWARQWLGGEARPTIRLPVASHAPLIFDVDEEEIRRRDNARQAWTRSVPVEGTATEKYLNSRGIYGPWPDMVRHDPAQSAFIVASQAPDGQITAIQRVYLNSDGTAKTDDDGKKIKRSFGPRYSGAVRLSGNDRALCLAEGPETGLSVWGATGIETWVGLGQVFSIKLDNVPLDRIIIVCRDDDDRRAASRKSLKQKIKDWRREGRTVLEVLPHAHSRGDKSDFNDTLQMFGPEAIRDRIEAVLTPPANNGQALPLPWARKSLAAEIEKAVNKLWAGRDDAMPPAIALKVSLGVGKTHEAIKQAVRHVEQERGNVVIAVPTHKLGGEIVERVRAAGGGIEVAVWRGREADDPEAVPDKMCRDIDAVKGVQRIGGDPQTMVCIKGDKRCAFADVCGYQRQRKQKGQIWIVTHQALFAQKPETIPTPSLVIIDESFHGAGLNGTSGHPVLVSEYQIARRPAAPGNDFKSADLAAELFPIRKKLAAVLEAQELGPLSRQALIDGGLTADECIGAGKNEWRRRSQPNIWPGMAPTARQKAINAVQENSEIPRMARMWRLLAELLQRDDIKLSGRLSVAEKSDGGATYRGLRLLWHDEIRAGWKAPTLHIDAIMQLDLIRPFLPNIELQASIKAAAPHQHLTQYVSRSFAKASLKKDDQVDQVWHWCLAKARKVGGKWLVVVQKAVEESIRERHAVPDFISLAHHNAVAGQDKWKDVTGLIAVGRTQPPVDAVARAAGALSGKVEEVSVARDGWYSQRVGTLADATGNAITLDIDTAGDGIAEAVRWSICEGQVENIIGRGRGVNRTEENPLEVHVLTNVPLEQQVDQVEEWRKPSIDEQLFAKSGIWLSSAGDMAKVHGSQRQAIRMARQRLDTESYKSSLYGNVSNLRCVTYQLSGSGRAKQIAVFDASVSDIEARLAETLGDLAYCGEQQDLNLPPVPAVSQNSDRQLLHQHSDGPIFSEMPYPALNDELPLSGMLADDMVFATREYLHDASWTQDDMAGRLGISRPQFTNALQQRFGLGPAPTRRLREVLATPPPRQQLGLFG